MSSAWLENVRDCDGIDAIVTVDDGVTWDRGWILVHGTLLGFSPDDVYGDAPMWRRRGKVVVRLLPDLVPLAKEHLYATGVLGKL